MTAIATAAPSAATIEAIKEKAKRLSILSMMSTTAAGSGHPTSCMSAAELVAGTFFYAMKFDPKNANSPDGDRFVLSKGHAAPVLYAALAEAGVFPESRVMTLREFSSELEGHPTPRIPGVDAATGSLGQGLSVGSGLAIGARMDKSPTIGEDGPSQMALEDIAIFRAVHSSTVLYPSDAISAERLTETMAGRAGINYLRTSRPKLPILYSYGREVLDPWI